jgi:glutamate/tyrosine decarboxylase-like PLP-dependent enzyme
MSIQKAAALLGLGYDAVRLIEVDEMFRMPIESLRQAIVRDIQNGKTPIAVAASAGTTSTGSIGPLDEIADLCHHFDLWLHAIAVFARRMLDKANRWHCAPDRGDVPKPRSGQSHSRSPECCHSRTVQSGFDPPYELHC